MTTPPVTPDEVRAHLNISPAGGALDVELQMHLEAATEAVEHRVGPLVTSTQVERGTASHGRVALTRRPVVAITDVTRVLNNVGGVIAGLDTATLTVDTDAGIVDLTTWGRSATFEVTYTAGRGAIEDIPARFKLAVLVVTKHLWEIQRGSGAKGSRWGTPDEGDDFYGDVVKGFALPRRALELIGFDEDIAVG